MDLNAAERAVLIDLIAQMVAADGDTSAEELNEILELDDELGEDGLFEKVIAAGSKAREDVLAAAASVERPKARDFIRTVLHDVAATDGIDDAEKELLSILAELWS